MLKLSGKCIECGVAIPKGDNCCADCFERPVKPEYPVHQWEPQPCRECGRFLTERPDQVWTFCNKTCSTEFYKKHYYKDRHCFWCARPFRGTKAAQFCSDSCRISAHRAGKTTQSNNGTSKPKREPLLKLRFSILERDNFRCTYCGRSSADGVELQVDHVHPKSKGGTWDKTNLTTACWECNIGKNDSILSSKPPKLAALQSVTATEGVTQR